MSPASGGLYRVTGSATVGEMRRPWSSVVKIAQSPARAKRPTWGTDPRHYGYWRREALAYERGILEDLGDAVRAPCCYLVEPIGDDIVRLWLEDVPRKRDDILPLRDYERAAWALGQFNALYASRRSVPQADWLCYDFLGGWLAEFAKHPPKPDSAEPELLRRLHALWLRRDALLAEFRGLPRTFCHRDTYRPNLVLEPSESAPSAEPVLLDWAYAGPGAVGEDAASLVWASLLWPYTEGVPASQFQQVVFAAYLDGLRDGGWAGDERRARRGFILAGALRWITGRHSHVQVVLQPAANPQRQRKLERDWGRPYRQLVQQWRETVVALLDLVEDG